MTEMKKCPQCSEESEPQFENCWNCGASLNPDDPADNQENVDVTGIKIQSHVETIPTLSYMGWSVITLLLFLPTGLMALLYSLLCEIAMIHEEFGRAQAYANQAMTWRVITYVLTVVFWFFFFITIMSVN